MFAKNYAHSFLIIKCALQMGCQHLFHNNCKIKQINETRILPSPHSALKNSSKTTANSLFFSIEQTPSNIKELLHVSKITQIYSVKVKNFEKTWNCKGPKIWADQKEWIQDNHCFCCCGERRKLYFECIINSMLPGHAGAVLQFRL